MYIALLLRYLEFKTHLIFTVTSSAVKLIFVSFALNIAGTAQSVALALLLAAALTRYSALSCKASPNLIFFIRCFT